MKICLVLSVYLFYSIDCIEAEAAPIVTTRQGTEIIGTVKELHVFGQQRRVNRYLGIPYAEPPVGDLRFKKPVPKKSLDSPFDASKFGNVCLQMFMFPIPENKFVSTGEDCLSLNVFVPEGSDGSQGNLPVMVWLHGGGFVNGFAEPYMSDTLSAHGNVIVVTVNYRLSIWGFLSTGDENARGNNALWDQHLAIKWVHDNIEGFGGDPQRVTIFGESAGSVSVVYQSLFEGNKGLIQRAIAQSGSITSLFASCVNPKQDAQTFGKLVGCDMTESSQLVECLRHKSPEMINATLNDVTNDLIKFQMPFIPTVDGEFVKEDPKDLLLGTSEISAKNREVFASVDLLMGMNIDEGLLALGPIIGVFDVENFEPNRTYFEETLLPFILPYQLGADFPEVVKDIIVHEYTDWSDPEDMKKRRDRLVALYTDVYFGVPLTETVSRHRLLAKDTKNTFKYLFDISPSTRILLTPSWAKRANHADELVYLFFEDPVSEGLMTYIPWRQDVKFTDWDMENAKLLMTMWTNFAKSG